MSLFTAFAFVKNPPPAGPWTPPGSPLVYMAPSSSYPGSGTTLNDLSGNGNNGTLTNGANVVTGPPAYVNLDGTNDYVTYGDIGDTYGSFSAFTWIYVETLATDKSIISKWRDGSNQRSWMMVMNNSSGGFRGYYDRSGTFGNVQSWATNTNITVNTWLFIGMTYNSTTGDCKGYLSTTNGSALNEIGSVSYGSSGDLFNSDSGLITGHEPDAGRYIDARYGHFFVYKSVLSTTDRDNIFTNTKAYYGY